MCGLFTTLNNAMGFTNSLMAIAEEPDEVAACFSAITDLYCTVLREVMARVPIDIVQICDDVASRDFMLVNPDFYREVMKPLHKRFYDTAKEVNPDVVCEMHCCGHCADIIDDFVEIGVTAWEPAEPHNDLSAIMAKHGTKLAIVGGYDNQKAQGDPSLGEEDIRQIVRDCIDACGKDEAFVFFNMIVGSDERNENRRNWMNDECEKYGATFYSEA